MNRRETEVADVIGTALFVEQDVPVSPSYCPAIEVVDHREAVLLAQGPVVDAGSIIRSGRAFGEEQRLIREGLVNELDVVEHHLATAPRLVPMESDSPQVAGCFRITEQRADALVNQVAVVIPAEDFLFAESGTSHRGTEVILEEVPLLLGGVDARLPGLRSHRLVLDRDSPDRNPFVLVSFDEFRVVVRPRLIELGLQLSAVQHVVVRLHECRRTPRAAEKSEPAPCSGDRALDEGNAESPVVIDAE